MASFALQLITCGFVLLCVKQHILKSFIKSKSLLSSSEGTGHLAHLKSRLSDSHFMQTLVLYWPLFEHRKGCFKGAC